MHVLSSLHACFCGPHGFGFILPYCFAVGWAQQWGGHCSAVGTVVPLAFHSQILCTRTSWTSLHLFHSFNISCAAAPRPLSVSVFGPVNFTLQRTYRYSARKTVIINTLQKNMQADNVENSSPPAGEDLVPIPQPPKHSCHILRGERELALILKKSSVRKASAMSVRMKAQLD